MYKNPLSQYLLIGTLLLMPTFIWTQSSITSCDCALDTTGLYSYLSTLTLNEQEPLAIDVPSVSAKFAILHGTIDETTPAKVQQLIATYPMVSTLVFMTIPGSADDEANLMAAKAINERGYTTYLPAVDAYLDALDIEAFIASGGVDLFLAGTTRIIDTNAEVGVHAWSDGTNEASSFPVGDPVHQSYISYYTGLGFSQEDAAVFYYFTINAAAAADIHVMTAEELTQYKMRTCIRPANCESTNGGDNNGNDTDGMNNDNSGNDNDGTNTNNTAEWTYLVYLNGSDLEQEEKGNSGTNDLQEMMAAGTTSNANIIVTTGGCNKPGWREIKRWQILNGQQMAINFSSSDNDMANPQNLTDFIDWAIATYPAQKYVLDLWNHGMDIRGYGHDENSDRELTIPQLKAAIANSNFVKAGNRFEIIGFDACLMATIEVQHSLQAFGNYFVGSEETEPGHGWNYTPIIQAMENKTVSNGAQLGKIIADNFYAQAQSMGTKNVTLSVTDLSQTNDLIGRLENLTATITAGGPNLLKKVQKARASAEEYSPSLQEPFESEDMVDIGDLMKKLKTTAPELTGPIDDILSSIQKAVTYNIKDETRPNATGIAMFWPHNKLSNQEELAEYFSEYYDPLDFSTSIKRFIKEEYARNASFDQTAPAGSFIDYQGETVRSHPPTIRNKRPNRWSAIQIPNSDDLEQVQVVLSTSSLFEEGIEGDVLLLGATLPDVEEQIDDSTGAIYAYEWDGYWLGINGYPAYIADIFEYEVDLGDDVISYFTRVKVLAILNPDEDGFGQDIIISYVREGDDADFEIESIVPESYGDKVMLTAKERINLKPGDRVQLLYEGFNPILEEDFYAIDDEAIFTIENGNQDLELGYDELDYGSYTLGFQLLDYSQNDTIIFDPIPFELSTATVETFAANNIQLFPNPAENNIHIHFPEFSGKPYQIQLTNLTGQVVWSQAFNSSNALLDVNDLSNGFYLVKLITNDQIFSDKVLIQR